MLDMILDLMHVLIVVWMLIIERKMDPSDGLDDPAITAETG